MLNLVVFSPAVGSLMQWYILHMQYNLFVCWNHGEEQNGRLCSAMAFSFGLDLQ